MGGRGGWPFIVAVLLAGPRVHAEDISPRDEPWDGRPEAPPPPVDDYRLSLGIAYAVPSTLMLTGGLVAATTDHDAAAVTGFSIAAVGVLISPISPPIVHWSRGSLAHGFLALGGSIASGILGATIGLGLGSCIHDWEVRCHGDSFAGFAGMELGYGLAYSAWGALDVALWGKREIQKPASTPNEPPPARERPRRNHRTRRLDRWTPLVSPVWASGFDVPRVSGVVFGVGGEV